MTHRPKNPLRDSPFLLICLAAAFLVVVLLLTTHYSLLTPALAQTFSGPTCSAGQCQGAIAVDSAGNIGIATATPSHTLTVFGDVRISKSGSGLIFPDGTVQISAAGGGIATTSAANVTPGAFNSAAGTGGNYSFPASLSIGTSVASQRLSVFNEGGSSGAWARITQSGGTNKKSGIEYYIDVTNLWQTYADNTDGNKFKLSYNNQTSTPLTVTTGGLVGIGTTTPTSRLVAVNTADGALSQFYGGSDNTSYEWVGYYSGLTRQGILLWDGAWAGCSNTTDEFCIKAENNNKLSLYSASDIRIMSVGNVGIGTTGPVVKLDVNDRIRVSDGSRYGYVQFGTDGGSDYNEGQIAYDNTDDTMSFRAGDVTSMYIKSGNVGIGATNPDAPLEVSYAANRQGLLLRDDSMAHGITNWHQTDTVLAAYEMDAAYGGADLWGYSAEANTGGIRVLGIIGVTDPTDTTPAITLYGAKKSGSSITTLADQETLLHVQNGGTTRMTVLGNGNVGIGTPGPAQKLTVAGTIESTTGGIKFPDGTVQTSAAGGVTSISAANVTPAGFNSAAGTGGNYSFPAKLGVGLSPTYTLSVKDTSAYTRGEAIAGSSAGYAVWSATNDASYTAYGELGSFGSASPYTYFGQSAANWVALYSAGPSSNGLMVGTYSAGPLILGTVNTERMRITAGGDVGIGKTPGQKLDVSGNILASGWLQAPTVYTSTGLLSSNSGSNPLRFGINDAEKMRIDTAGKVGIGTINPGFNLDVAPNSGAAVIRAKSADGSANLVMDRAETSASASVNFRTAGADNWIAGTGIYSAGSDFQIGDGSAAKLTIATDGTVTVGGGTGKINAGTIDPLYTINGKRYATYLPSMTGVKEETTGVLALRDPNQRMYPNAPNDPCHSERSEESLSAYKCVINFKNLEEGSDLWLFARITNILKNEQHFEQISVLLSPAFDGKVWYEKNVAERTITIYAQIANGESQAVTYEVSYRLTAPRFDSAEWLNTSKDSGEGFNLDKLLR